MKDLKNFVRSGIGLRIHDRLTGPITREAGDVSRENHRGSHAGKVRSKAPSFQPDSRRAHWSFDIR